MSVNSSISREPDYFISSNGLPNIINHKNKSYKSEKRLDLVKYLDNKTINQQNKLLTKRQRYYCNNNNNSNNANNYNNHKEFNKNPITNTNKCKINSTIIKYQQKNSTKDLCEEKILKNISNQRLKDNNNNNNNIGVNNDDDL